MRVCRGVMCVQHCTFLHVIALQTMASKRTETIIDQYKLTTKENAFASSRTNVGERVLNLGVKKAGLLWVCTCWGVIRLLLLMFLLSLLL
jgi:hypothetical protein